MVRRTPASHANAAPFDWEAATRYTYTDEVGTVLFEVGRLDGPNGKRISQRRPKEQGGWLYNLSDVRRVLWRLPEVLAANTVFMVEGEKAAEALNSALDKGRELSSCIATTNPQGAGKWRDEFAQALAGKTVVVLPDNDEPGAKHADTVCKSVAPVAASVQVLRLPDLLPKGDVADWFEAGHSLDKLLDLAEAAPQWEPERKGSPFRFLTLGEVLAQEPPAWLVGGMLTRGGTSLLTAKHAGFKSFFALDMALCVATGKAWHGRRVEAGPVLYIAAEGSAGLQRRARAWLEFYEMSEDQARLYVWNRPITLHQPETLQAFIAALEPMAPALIVVDTLARCAVGLDENSSGDMGIFADAVDALAKATGTHVLTVHHNNKGGEYRGSTALPAAVDTHLSLDRKGDTVTLSTEKQKDAEPAGPLTFASILPPSGSLVFQLKDVEEVRTALTDSEGKVLEALAPFGAEGATYSEWKLACDVSDATFKRAKEKLRDTGQAVLVAGCTEGARGARFAVRGPENRAKVGVNVPTEQASN
jgi:hypothetical protein